MLPHLLAITLIPLITATTYPLSESYSGSNFFSGFKADPSTYDNTTNGDVFWAGPSNSSLLYVSTAGTVIMKVDNTTSVPYNEKRYAPKILSKASYGVGTVWVFDALHLPYGCSVWPAFWTQGPNWPNGGEIDIIEGINLQTTNQAALHSLGSDCSASTSTLSGGVLTYNNCTIGANSDSGCTTNFTSAASYGAGFAAAGGGVYVTEFGKDGIRIWFYTRSAVPSSITSSTSTIDTSTLGTPTAEYLSTSCDIESNFQPQTLTLDITLCGDWAGVASLLAETCPALTGTNTCYTTYVINDGSTTYQNAYFEINYLNVYSTNSTSNATSTTGATTTVTSGPGSTTKSTATKTGSAGKRLELELRGAAVGWIVGVVLAIFGGAVLLM